MQNRKKILIISGDPNSINSEIIYKAWNKIGSKIKKKIIVLGNYELLKNQFKILKYPLKLNKVNHVNDNINNENLNIFDVKLNFKNPFNVEKLDASNYVKESLNLGHNLSLKSNILGLINCAVNKKLLPKNSGVTEFLAKKCKLFDNSEVMMIRSKNFSVCPITTHLDLKNVSKKIKIKLILTKIKTIQENFYKLFNKKPKIGVLGLNPHNAELRSDSEEVKEIMPAINKLKKLGFNIRGPLISDTVFI